MKIYLCNSKTPVEKQHNKQSLQLTEAIRAKRIIEAQNGQHGFKTESKLKASFLIIMKSYVMKKQGRLAKLIIRYGLAH